MALNFTVSYTFSPATTISSSQVNTNTSDVASVFQGLEAETKTLAKLKVDIDPTTALEVATKQYVDHYATWRRPVLQFSSVTTVAVEAGLDGTSGHIPILFPDGSVRTETTSTRTTFDITRNAVLVTSGAQSGLTGATSEATNTWYALYAVKVTDSSVQWVTVGSTVLNLQANFATLNTAYGTSGWVYLGLIRNGDNGSATGDILTFTQTGSRTYFRNSVAITSNNPQFGTMLASTTGATSLSWSYSAGTGATSVPDNITAGLIMGQGSPRAAAVYGLTNLNHGLTYFIAASAIPVWCYIWGPITQGLGIADQAASTSNAMSICLAGFDDAVLGVGSNPLL